MRAEGRLRCPMSAGHVTLPYRKIEAMQPRACLAWFAVIASICVVVITAVMRFNTHYEFAKKERDVHAAYVRDHCGLGQIKLSDGHGLGYCKERDDLSRVSPSDVALRKTSDDLGVGILHTFFGGSMAFFLVVVWSILGTAFTLMVCLCRDYVKNRNRAIIPMTHKKAY